MNLDTQITNLKTLVGRKDFINSLYSLWSQLSIISLAEDHNKNTQEQEIPPELKQHYVHGFLANQTTQQTIEIFPVHNHPIHIEFAYSRAKNSLKQSVPKFDEIITIDVHHELHPKNNTIVRVIGHITFKTSFN